MCRHFQSIKRLKMKRFGNRVFESRADFCQGWQIISFSLGDRERRHIHAPKEALLAAAFPSGRLMLMPAPLATIRHFFRVELLST
jgi:hypothetical protein